MVKCPVCGKGFRKKHLLSYHINLLHGQKGRFVCPTCQKSFHGNSNLKRHILTHSKDSELTPCSFCGKAYKMKEHMAFHLGMQAYVCPICAKTCSDMKSIPGQEKIVKSNIGFKSPIDVKTVLQSLPSDESEKSVVGLKAHICSETTCQTNVSGTSEASLTTASNSNSIETLSTQSRSNCTNMTISMSSQKPKVTPPLLPVASPALPQTQEPRHAPACDSP